MLFGLRETIKNQENEVPKLMEGWSCNQNSYSPPLTNHECWYGRSGVFVGFAEFFNLRDVLNNSSAIYEDKTIYFKPDCSPISPREEQAAIILGFWRTSPFLLLLLGIRKIPAFL